MAFEPGKQPEQSRFTPTNVERIWELFFGKKWSLGHIGKEYGVEASQIASAINTESARRWRIHHPHVTNRKRLA